MQDTFFYYKKWFLTLVLLLGYAYLHVKLTGLYTFTLEQLINFDINLPFAQRVLVPAMGHIMSFFLPFSAAEIFFLLEIIWTGLLFLALYSLLKEYFPKTTSELLAWLFILLLPLMTVLNYRYSLGKEATYFYCYDTPTLVFTLFGFLFCLRQQWVYFIITLVLATFNRESSILLVLLIPALHWQNYKKIKIPFLIALMVYIAARALIYLFLLNYPGHYAQFFYGNTSITYFTLNLIWLATEANFLYLIFSFMGLTLFWFVFFDYIPKRYQPIRFVAFLYFLGLLIVGIFLEARIFEEIAALLYFPVCIGVNRWLKGKELNIDRSSTVISYIGRYFIIGTLILIVLANRYIDHFIKLLTAS